MLELYNTTDRVRRVPKFRYAGQYTIKPKTAVDIEEYMADFYKPWARIGLVVRMRSKSNPKPDESKSINDAITFTEKDHTGHSGATAPVTQETLVIGDEKTEAIKTPEITDIPGEEIVEAKDNVADETPSNEETSVKPTYTRDELLDMGIQELKDLAASLNVVPEDTRKKSSYADAILGKTSE